jgi:probable HAF family extracellular repeat protein
MMQMVHSRFNALLSACVLSLIATAGWSQSITWLGALGGSLSKAYAVSANGVVVGWAANAAGYERAFRWQNGVMQDLGTLGGNQSEAYGVSADGAVVVGQARNAAGQWRAFRWTESSGRMDDLGTLGGNESWARGVSADGTVVVGWAFNAAGQPRAFRWTESGGMQDLGAGVTSRAYAVSANGVVVGESGGRALRWQNGVMQNLGTLGGNRSEAYGVSADGAVVVGWARNAAGQVRAFRWTESSGRMDDLGTLPGGDWSFAYGVSADGAVVVCSARNAAGQSRAVRWTASGGMEDLNTTYASLLTDGSRLVEALAISPDGRYIVGRGWNAATYRLEAFLLDTRCTTHNGDVDANGCVDDADLLAVLFAFGNTGSNLGRVDVNCDEVVDDADLLTVLFNFGSGC